MGRADDDTLESASPGTVGPADETVALPGEDDAAAAGGGYEAPAPERAGEYVVGSAIAQGGFGVVYRGTHAAHGAPAAIKVMHAELAAHPDLIARFEREVEAMRRVRHPNVVEVLDLGRLEDGRPYLVMELLDGTDVERLLRARGRLPPEEALALLDPLCSALEAAHAQAIVHRDIKPSNVFVCGGDVGGRVVLLDFGVAKLLDAPGPSLTTSRQIVGSPSSMSPEQLMSRPVDARADIYALGALTYMMLTGEPPFSGTSFVVLRQLHLFASPPRPSARARVSQSLDGVVLQALSKDPAERQRSVGEFLAGVRAAIAAPGARGPGGGAARRSAVGVYVEVQADPGALDDAEAALLDDLESIMPLLLDELARAGFAAAVEAGTTALVTADRPLDPARDEAARRGALQAALSLKWRLDARAGRDPRVHVRFCVHVGELVAGADGALTGGDLLELAAWVPEGAAEGVFASPAVLDGLGIAAQPAPMSRRSSAMLRVIEADRRPGQSTK
ncbi:serine/threonine-protein kinase [Sorangium sp. So ce131]|uniref:serine/threonine-protein kinase n=1 Tax=Sorangium sp. So ce131 TaxID=3133282 RepID=UPI003F6052D8